MRVSYFNIKRTCWDLVGKSKTRKASKIWNVYFVKIVRIRNLFWSVVYRIHSKCEKNTSQKKVPILTIFAQ